MSLAGESAIESYEFAHGLTGAMVKNWPADQWTAQPGGMANHALWTLGHLAVSAEDFALIAGLAITPPPEGYRRLFANGSVPSPNAADYPPADEVVQWFERTARELIEEAKKLTDAEWSQPAARGQPPFARIRMHGLTRAAWHEGWHVGQLSLLRRALGMKALMG